VTDVVTLDNKRDCIKEVVNMQAAALYRSSIGKKALMAVTGLIWIGYVVLHMYGNLKAFEGAAYFNEYAEGLRHLGAPVFGYRHLLTIARVVLIASLGLHVWAALALYRQAMAARPATYASRKMVQANYASLTMRYGGIAIVFFVFFHLAHLTWGVPGIHNEFVHGDAYRNMVSGFQFLPWVIIYLVALVALGFHLFHGVWSMFQSLGLNNQDWDGVIRAAAWVLAIVVPVGFAVVPIAVQLGILTL
jgi:succinate dehydrogenase / fumarate reductase, cytochrome b subunit